MPRRIAVVTQRFWPQIGSTERIVENLAVEFQRQGCQATIVTPQWDRNWPSEVRYREVPVVRLPHAPMGGWGTLRYMYGLSRWLREHSREFDAVLVSRLRHDAYAAVGELRETSLPVVVRCEGTGASGDCQWHGDVRFGLRIRRRCQGATAFIAPSDAATEELREAGFARERIHRIDDGTLLPPLRNPHERDLARAALADVNRDLAAPTGPLVLFLGRLQKSKGVFDLVNAWPSVLARCPSARLWIVGEGPDREALFHRISDLGFKYQIPLPGAFDQVEDLLQAADLLVVPSHEPGASLALLEALAAGLPIVASDRAGAGILATEQTGFVFLAGDVRALGDTLACALENADAAVAVGSRARDLAAERYALERCAREHLELIRRLARSK
jgi:glycosyltransferase involved in cell wall biosynthesis